MNRWLQAVAVGAVMLVVSWLVLMVLAARLPPGVLRELAGFLPNCVKAASALRSDPAVPRRAKVAVGLAALWCLSPIDLVPEFLPVIGPLDDIVLTAIVLRWVGRRVGVDALRALAGV